MRSTACLEGSVRLPKILISALIVLTVPLGPARLQARSAEAGPTPRPSRQPARARALETAHVPGEIVVKFKAGAKPFETAALKGLKARFPSLKLREIAGSKPTRSKASPVRMPDAYVAELPAGSSLEASLEQLRSAPEVEYAEPNYIVRPDQVLNDPFLSSQGSWGQPYADLWGLHVIEAQDAWSLATGEGITVAVIDTGVDASHVELAGRVWVNPGEDTNGNGRLDGAPVDCTLGSPPVNGDYNCSDDDDNGFVDDLRGWNFITHRSNAMQNDAHGHGTHVAGTIAAAADNGSGIVGVAFGARVMDVSFINGNGLGTSVNGALAILYAADNGADVINMSWGGPPSLLLDDALDAAHGLGVVLVAAAGNDDFDLDLASPARHPDVISVAASDHEDLRAGFSNWGEGLSLSAPGGASVDPDDPQRLFCNILSLRADASAIDPTLSVTGDYVRLHGTSMASPHVAGVAALVLSRRPGLSPPLVRRILEATADDIANPGFDVYTGHGRVNAGRALLLTDHLATRPEYSARFVSATQKVAPDGPATARIEIRNESLATGFDVSVEIFDVHHDGATPLHSWTIPVLRGGGKRRFSRGLALVEEGLHRIEVHVNRAGMDAEALTWNNVGSADVDVSTYQFVAARLREQVAGLGALSSQFEPRQPTFHGDLVAWRDLRNVVGNIFVQDVSSGEETNVTANYWAQRSPALGSSGLVFEDYGADALGDIYYSSPTAGVVPIATAPASAETEPAIGDRFVAWLRDGTEIWVHDLLTGTTSPVALQPGRKSSPAVDGGQVYWIEEVDGQYRIASANLLTGLESTFFEVSQGEIDDVDVGESHVVWLERGPNGTRLSAFDRDLGELIEIPTFTLDLSDPAVSESFIVWTGLPGGDLYAYDLDRGATHRVTYSGTASNPAVAGSRIVWDDRRHSAEPFVYYELYGATVAPYPDAPRGLTAAREEGAVRLSWSAVDDGDLREYAVYRRKKQGAPFQRIGTVETPGFLDTDPAGDPLPVYRVTAIDSSNGESGFSAPSSPPVGVTEQTPGSPEGGPSSRLHLFD